MGNSQCTENKDKERPGPPGQPHVYVSEGVRGVLVKWAPPTFDGNTPVTSYIVHKCAVGSNHWERAHSSPTKSNEIVIHGLVPGQPYQVRVVAENSIGASLIASPPSEAFIAPYDPTLAREPEFVLGLRDVTAIEGERVEFEVEVDGVPLPEVKFYKDGFEIYDGQKASIMKGPGGLFYLIFRTLGIEDSGEIKCVATNEAGEASTAAKLQVEAPPRAVVTRQLEEGVIFDARETLRLRVSYTGRPTPEVAWYHEGVLLESGGRVEIETSSQSSTLKIANVRRADRGEYTVRLSSPLGDDSQAILVTVTDRPTPPGIPTITKVTTKSVELEWTSPEDDGGCKVGSYVVEYYRKGWNIWLKGGSFRQLSGMLSDLLPGSEYKFRVKAENPYGFSDPSGESVAVLLPADPKSPQTSATTENLDYIGDETTIGSSILPLDGEEVTNESSTSEVVYVPKPISAGSGTDRDLSELFSDSELASDIPPMPSQVWSAPELGFPDESYAPVPRLRQVFSDVEFVPPLSPVRERESAPMPKFFVDSDIDLLSGIGSSSEDFTPEDSTKDNLAECENIETTATSENKPVEFPSYPQLELPPVEVTEEDDNLSIDGDSDDDKKSVRSTATTAFTQGSRYGGFLLPKSPARMFVHEQFLMSALDATSRFVGNPSSRASEVDILEVEEDIELSEEMERMEAQKGVSNPLYEVMEFKKEKQLSGSDGVSGVSSPSKSQPVGSTSSEITEQFTTVKRMSIGASSTSLSTAGASISETLSESYAPSVIPRRRKSGSRGRVSESSDLSRPPSAGPRPASRSSLIGDLASSTVEKLKSAFSSLRSLTDTSGGREQERRGSLSSPAPRDLSAGEPPRPPSRTRRASRESAREKHLSGEPTSGASRHAEGITTIGSDDATIAPRPPSRSRRISSTTSEQAREKHLSGDISSSTTYHELSATEGSVAVGEEGVAPRPPSRASRRGSAATQPEKPPRTKTQDVAVHTPDKTDERKPELPPKTSRPSSRLSQTSPICAQLEQRISENIESASPSPDSEDHVVIRSLDEPVYTPSTSSPVESGQALPGLNREDSQSIASPLPEDAETAPSPLPDNVQTIVGPTRTPDSELVRQSPDHGSSSSGHSEMFHSEHRFSSPIQTVLGMLRPASDSPDHPDSGVFEVIHRESLVQQMAYDLRRNGSSSGGYESPSSMIVSPGPIEEWEDDPASKIRWEDASPTDFAADTRSTELTTSVKRPLSKQGSSDIEWIDVRIPITTLNADKPPEETESDEPGLFSREGTPNLPAPVVKKMDLPSPAESDSYRTAESGTYRTAESEETGSSKTEEVQTPRGVEQFDFDSSPVFIRSLSSQAVKIGSRARLIAEVRSTESVEATWCFNDAPLVMGPRFETAEDDNCFALEINPVTKEDQGVYVIVAKSSTSVAKSSANIEVIIPKSYKEPTFLEELRAILTEAGTVALEVKVVGVPTPVLKWYKDGVEIKAGDTFALTATSNDPNSLGTYTCEAINCMGRAVSTSKVNVRGSTADVTIKRVDVTAPLSDGGGAVPLFVEDLYDQKIKVGEFLTLSVRVSVPPYPISVEWYNKNQLRVPSDKYHHIDVGDGEYCLEISPVELDDDGEWRCQVVSEGGVSSSACVVTLSVPKNYRKPRFLEKLKAVLTEEGLVSFECRVVGFPTPQLRWYKDGRELKPGDVYQLSGTNSLGSYSCVAKNCMGEAESSAELTLDDIQNQLNDEERSQLELMNRPPQFIIGLKSAEAKVGDPFRFVVQVTAVANPSLTWFHEEEAIEQSERYQFSSEDQNIFYLDVNPVEVGDQGEWKCVALNDFGHSVTSCSLRLVIPRSFKKPRFLEGLRAVLSEEGTVNLECKVIGVPQPILKWFKDGVELKPGDIHRIMSGQDGTCCLGTYTCEAHNCMGTASSSAALLSFEEKQASAEQPVIPLIEHIRIARNPSLSTIQEEMSQLSITTHQTQTLEEKQEVSVSLDGREVSLSLYETPDLTEEEAQKVVDMFAEELSPRIAGGQNVVELPPLRFIRESSTAGRCTFEATVIDVQEPDFTSAKPIQEEDDLRTEANVEEFSAIDIALEELKVMQPVESKLAPAFKILDIKESTTKPKSEDVQVEKKEALKSPPAQGRKVEILADRQDSLANIPDFVFDSHEVIARLSESEVHVQPSEALVKHDAHVKEAAASLREEGESVEKAVSEHKVDSGTVSVVKEAVELIEEAQTSEAARKEKVMEGSSVGEVVVSEAVAVAGQEHCRSVSEVAVQELASQSVAPSVDLSTTGQVLDELQLFSLAGKVATESEPVRDKAETAPETLAVISEVAADKTREVVVAEEVVVSAREEGLYPTEQMSASEAGVPVPQVSVLEPVTETKTSSVGVGQTFVMEGPTPTEIPEVSESAATLALPSKTESVIIPASSDKPIVQELSVESHEDKKPVLEVVQPAVPEEGDQEATPDATHKRDSLCSIPEIEPDAGEREVDILSPVSEEKTPLSIPVILEPVNEPEVVLKPVEASLPEAVVDTLAVAHPGKTDSPDVSSHSDSIPRVLGEPLFASPVISSAVALIAPEPVAVEADLGYSQAVPVLEIAGTEAAVPVDREVEGVNRDSVIISPSAEDFSPIEATDVGSLVLEMPNVNIELNKSVTSLSPATKTDSPSPVSKTPSTEYESAVEKQSSGDDLPGDVLPLESSVESKKTYTVEPCPETIKPVVLSEMRYHVAEEKVVKVQAEHLQPEIGKPPTPATQPHLPKMETSAPAMHGPTADSPVKVDIAIKAQYYQQQIAEIERRGEVYESERSEFDEPYLTAREQLSSEDDYQTDADLSDIHSLADPVVAADIRKIPDLDLKGLEQKASLAASPVEPVVVTDQKPVSFVQTLTSPDLSTLHADEIVSPQLGVEVRKVDVFSNVEPLTSFECKSSEVETLTASKYLTEGVEEVKVSVKEPVVEIPMVEASAQESKKLEDSIKAQKEAEGVIDHRDVATVASEMAAQVTTTAISTSAAEPDASVELIDVRVGTLPPDSEKVVVESSTVHLGLEAGKALTKEATITDDKMQEDKMQELAKQLIDTSSVPGGLQGPALSVFVAADEGSRTDKRVSTNEKVIESQSAIDTVPVAAVLEHEVVTVQSTVAKVEEAVKESVQEVRAVEHEEAICQQSPFAAQEGLAVDVEITTEQKVPKGEVSKPVTAGEQAQLQEATSVAEDVAAAVAVVEGKLEAVQAVAGDELKAAKVLDAGEVKPSKIIPEQKAEVVTSTSEMKGEVSTLEAAPISVKIKETATSVAEDVAAAVAVVEKKPEAVQAVASEKLDRELKAAEALDAGDIRPSKIIPEQKVEIVTSTTEVKSEVSTLEAAPVCMKIKETTTTVTADVAAAVAVVEKELESAVGAVSSEKLDRELKVSEVLDARDVRPSKIIPEQKADIVTSATKGKGEVSTLGAAPVSAEIKETATSVREGVAAAVAVVEKKSEAAVEAVSSDKAETKLKAAEVLDARDVRPSKVVSEQKAEVATTEAKSEVSTLEAAPVSVITETGTTAVEQQLEIASAGSASDPKVKDELSTAIVAELDVCVKVMEDKPQLAVGDVGAIKLGTEGQMKDESESQLAPEASLDEKIEAAEKDSEKKSTVSGGEVPVASQDVEQALYTGAETAAETGRGTSPHYSAPEAEPTAAPVESVVESGATAPHVETTVTERGAADSVSFAATAAKKVDESLEVTSKRRIKKAKPEAIDVVPLVVDKERSEAESTPSRLSKADKEAEKLALFSDVMSEVSLEARKSRRQAESEETETEVSERPLAATRKIAVRSGTDDSESLSLRSAGQKERSSSVKDAGLDVEPAAAPVQQRQPRIRDYVPGLSPLLSDDERREMLIRAKAQSRSKIISLEAEFQTSKVELRKAKQEADSCAWELAEAKKEVCCVEREPDEEKDTLLSELAALREKMKSLEKERANLKTEQLSLRREIQMQKDVQRDCRTQLDRIDRDKDRYCLLMEDIKSQKSKNGQLESTKTELDEITAKLQELRKTLNDMKCEADIARNERDDLLSSVHQLRSELRSSEESCSSLLGERDTVKRDIERLARKQERFQRDLKNSRESLETYVSLSKVVFGEKDKYELLAKEARDIANQKAEEYSALEAEYAKLLEQENKKRMEEERLDKEREEKRRIDEERRKKEKEEREKTEREEQQKLEEQKRLEDLKRKNEEEERLAEEKRKKELAEKEKIRKQKEEEERLEKERIKVKQEEERIKKEQEEEKQALERKRKEEEKAEQERIKKEKEEQERIKKEKEEQERIEKEKEEQKRAVEKKRKEEEKVEQERIKKENEEQERMKKEQEEQKRAMEKLRKEEEKKAQEERERKEQEEKKKAEEEKMRLKTEQEEKERLAKEEKARLEAEKAKEEKVKKEEEEKKRAEEEKIKKEEEEKKRVAKEKKLKEKKLAEEKKKEEEKLSQEKKRKEEEIAEKERLRKKKEDEEKAAEEKKLAEAKEKAAKEEKKRLEEQKIAEEKKARLEEEKIVVTKGVVEEEKQKEKSLSRTSSVQDRGSRGTSKELEGNGSGKITRRNSLRRMSVNGEEVVVEPKCYADLVASGSSEDLQKFSPKRSSLRSSLKHKSEDRSTPAESGSGLRAEEPVEDRPKEEKDAKKEVAEKTKKKSVKEEKETKKSDAKETAIAQAKEEKESKKSSVKESTLAKEKDVKKSLVEEKKASEEVPPAVAPVAKPSESKAEPVSAVSAEAAAELKEKPKKKSVKSSDKESKAKKSETKDTTTVSKSSEVSAEPRSLGSTKSISELQMNTSSLVSLTCAEPLVEFPTSSGQPIAPATAADQPTSFERFDDLSVDKTLLLRLQTVSEVDDIPFDSIGADRKEIAFGSSGDELECQAKGRRDPKKKPKFSMKLKDLEATRGSRIKLTCSVLGSPEPQIEWMKNGFPIQADGAKYYHRQDPTGIVSLEVKDLLREDSGEYTCVAKNIHGRASCTADLRVRAEPQAEPSPPTFTSGIQESYVGGKDELVLEIKISGHPLPRVVWHKDGNKLQSSRYKTSMTDDGHCRLTITSPSLGDAGHYTCRAENRVWKDEISCFVALPEEIMRRVIPLSVPAPMNVDMPKVVRGLSDQEVPIGGTVIWIVEATGTPVPEAEWLHDGRAIFPSPKIRTSIPRPWEYQLIVYNVTASDLGTYSCRLSNTWGTVRTVAQLSLKSATKAPLDGDIGVGAAAALLDRPEPLITAIRERDLVVTCKVAGHPTPKVTWSKGSRDLISSPRTVMDNDGDTYTLVVKKMLSSDSGTYSVEAKNIHGGQKAYFTVRVKEGDGSTDWELSGTAGILKDVAEKRARRFRRDVPGAIPCPPVASNVGQNFVSLSWQKPVDNGGAPIMAYKVEAWLLGEGAQWQELGVSNITYFDVFNLKQDREYLFRVTPRNKYGWGEGVTTLNPIKTGFRVTLPKFVTPLNPQERVLVGSALELLCEVVGEPTPLISWKKDGMEVDRERCQISSENSKQMLRIGNVTEEDQGKYLVEASNQGGIQTSFTSLLVVTDPKILEADEKFKRELQLLSKGNYPMAPQFTMRARDRRIQVSHPVRITCQIVGFPKPEVKWFKEDKMITQDDHYIFWHEENFYTLEIQNTRFEDSGTYKIEAANTLGAIRSQCHLVVDGGVKAYISPLFMHELEDRVIPEGGTLYLVAKIDAYPVVGVTWHRDGLRLRSSRKYTMTLDRDGTVTLEVSHFTSRDAGTYTCTVTNEMGQAESSAKVTLKPKNGSGSGTGTPNDKLDSQVPRFLKKPRSTEVLEGETLIIVCEVTGDPKPEIVWLRDFLKPGYFRDADCFVFEGEGPEYRLEIPCVKLDHTGTYSVIARNMHGEAKAVMSVQVKAKDFEDAVLRQTKLGTLQTIPEVVQPLRDLRCCDGDSVTFECRVGAQPPPYIRWTKSGKSLNKSKDFEETYDGQVARLHIHQVFPEDEGEYTCVAYNDLGRVSTSACLVVDIAHDKENDVTGPLDTRPQDCGGFSNFTTPRTTPLRCMRSASPVVLSSPVPRRRNYTEELTPMPRLRMRAAAPKFYAVPHNRIAEVGDTVRFQCAVAGHPVPKVIWDKDHVSIHDSDRFSFEERNDVRVMEIRNVQPEDAGLYRVTVENDLGRVQASARLDIITKSSGNLSSISTGSSTSSRLGLSSPYFSKRVTSTSSRLGGTASFRAEIRGGSLPRPSWYHNYSKVINGDKVTVSRSGAECELVIRNVCEEDYGVVTCVVEFDGECETCSALLLCDSDFDGLPPTVVRGLEDLVVKDGEEVELVVEVQGSEPIRTIWVCDEEELSESDYTGSAGVRKLRLSNPKDGSVYVCEAYNAFGESETWCQVRIGDRRTRPAVAQPSFSPFFTQPLRNVTVEEGERIEIPVCVEGYPSPIVTFEVKGQTVDPQDSRFSVGQQGTWHTLSVFPALLTDNGVIRCIASNGHGTVSADCTVSVYDSVFDRTNKSPEHVDSAYKSFDSDSFFCPEMEGATDLVGVPAEILNEPCDMTVLRGDDIVLSVEYLGIPEPTVAWLKAGKVLEESDRVKIEVHNGTSQLRISGANENDCGKYIVVAANGFGSDCRFSSVNVEGVPAPPGGAPNVSEARFGSATLSWYGSIYDGGSAVTGYVVEAREEFAPEWSFAVRCNSTSAKVTDLKPRAFYQFRVRAVNKHGESEPSLETDLICLEDGPPQRKISSISVFSEDEYDADCPFSHRWVKCEDGSRFAERYSVHDELGKGRFGVVHRAYNLEIGQARAAKVVRCIKQADKDKVKEEIKIMNMLQHKKLLQLESAFEFQKEIILVTELVSGGELFERVVADDFTLTEKDAILFMRQICEGVQYMHQLDIVHLDLKPENILCVSPTSHSVKIIDFGLARKLIPDTPVRVLFGTPEFIPPEIVSYEPISLASDMWAVGVICYVLLSGLSPFMGENDTETFANITRADFDFCDEAFRHISTEAKQFIAGLLVKKPETRLSASDCLKHKWLAQAERKMKTTKISTEKLKKFIVRRKWQANISQRQRG